MGKRKKIVLNDELARVAGIEYVTDENGTYPALTEQNVKAVDNYVRTQSSYAVDKSDNFVPKYFQEKSGDDSMSSVITKIILIDTIDSTNLKRHLGKNYYVKMAERIVENNLEALIKDGKPIGPIFKKIASFPKRPGMKKADINFFIFLSKYVTRTNQFSYNRDDYSIMDNVVKDYLPLYARDYKSAQRRLKAFREEYDYDGYCRFIKDEILRGLNVTRNQLDHFVWFSFKEAAADDVNDKKQGNK